MARTKIVVHLNDYRLGNVTIIAYVEPMMYGIIRISYVMPIGEYSYRSSSSVMDFPSVEIKCVGAHNYNKRNSILVYDLNIKRPFEAEGGYKDYVIAVYSAMRIHTV